MREVGRHDELLARPSGVYARLYALQMFEDGLHAPAAQPDPDALTSDRGRRGGPRLLEPAMITSMTGFASATHEARAARPPAPPSRASTTASSTSSCACRGRSRPWRARCAALVQQRVARGRVEVTINVQARRATTSLVELDEVFASRLSAAIERARALGIVSGTLQPSDLLRFPQALAVREAPVGGARGRSRRS